MRLEDLRIGQHVRVIGQYAGDWERETPEIVGLVRRNRGGSTLPLWVDDVWLMDSGGQVYDGFKPSELIVVASAPQDAP